MRPLLPTLKERKRYIVYELLSEQPLGKGAERAVLNHLERTLGLFDGAKAGVLAVRYEEQLQAGIIKVGHTSADKVKAAFLLLTTIEGKKAIPRVRGVSGILQKTERFMPTERTKMILAE